MFAPVTEDPTSLIRQSAAVATFKGTAQRCCRTFAPACVATLLIGSRQQLLANVHKHCTAMLPNVFALYLRTTAVPVVCSCRQQLSRSLHSDAAEGFGLFEDHSATVVRPERPYMSRARHIVAPGCHRSGCRCVTCTE
jgi:hypothetical protein